MFRWVKTAFSKCWHGFCLMPSSKLEASVTITKDLQDTIKRDDFANENENSQHLEIKCGNPFELWNEQDQICFVKWCHEGTDFVHTGNQDPPWREERVQNSHGVLGRTLPASLAMDWFLNVLLSQVSAGVGATIRDKRGKRNGCKEGWGGHGWERKRQNTGLREVVVWGQIISPLTLFS